MFYAITINPMHKTFNLDLDAVLDDLQEMGCDYIEIVNHNNDHLHGLVYTTLLIDKIWRKQSLHFERVRNVKAYQKYMHNHDKVDVRKWGDLPYHEVDSIVDSIINIGAIATVQKYGWQALKYYKQMKEFEKDFTEQERE